MNLIKNQRLVAKDNFNTTLWLEGPAGTGKTTAAVERIKQLIRDGVPARSILLLVPQATLAIPYREALRRSRVKASTDISIATLGSLALEIVDLFWPLIADEVSFSQPHKRPHFLSLEMVQYAMTRFVEPEIEARDYFNSVHISRNRLFTQIADNLNKAALVGFSHEEIAQRLRSAWRGDVETAYIFEDAQTCADLFREACYRHNLLDFSLQVTLFVDLLWPLPQVRQYVRKHYRHLIVDNVEEDTPATHDILLEWLALAESGLVIYDTDAGYRRFLGADPKEAQKLKKLCKVHVALDRSYVMSPEVTALTEHMAQSLSGVVPAQSKSDAAARDAMQFPPDISYYPQMIDWAVENIASLVHDEGVPPNEIVVLAPYLPDALRFSLVTRLDELKVPSRTHRPSRALRDEPAARALLTLAKLAHPAWNRRPGSYDLAYALTAAVADLDLIRARLLAEVIYPKDTLLPFDALRERVQSRITFDLGARYERLRAWIEAYRAEDPAELDVFLSRLFGELLSQRGFGFHDDLDAAHSAANLIDSARAFRQTARAIDPDLDVAPEYVAMVDRGLIGNLYLRDWEAFEENAVLIAPAYTYLMSNRPVDYQLWLNVGSPGWGMRLFQPLTHPYVMSRQWQAGQLWTDADEQQANEAALHDLALGLLRRCRKRVYLGTSQYGEQGFEQRGPLLLAVQRSLRRIASEGSDVPAAS